MLLTIEMDNELIADVIHEGCLYGINYWGECDASFDYIVKVLSTDGIGFAVNELDEYTNEVIATHVVFWQDVQKGLVLMNTKWFDYINDMYNGNYDCITGDILLQLTLFGEIRYA